MTTMYWHIVMIYNSRDMDIEYSKIVLLNVSRNLAQDFLLKFSGKM